MLDMSIRRTCAEKQWGTERRPGLTGYRRHNLAHLQPVYITQETLCLGPWLHACQQATQQHAAGSSLPKFTAMQPRTKYGSFAGVVQSQHEDPGFLLAEKTDQTGQPQPHSKPTWFGTAVTSA